MMQQQNITVIPTLQSTIAAFPSHREGPKFHDCTHFCQPAAVYDVLIDLVAEAMFSVL